MNSVSIVVPVYNSQSTLEILTSRIVAVMDALKSPYEIIYVNDGSRDQSWSKIEELVKKYKNVRGLDFSVNAGQHNALLCGIRAARYELTITMDDDLQHPPEEIPKLLAALTDQFDIVYGSPMAKPHGFYRTLASNTSKLVLKKSMGVAVASNISSFRLFRTKVRNAFAGFHGFYFCVDVLLSWGTSRFSAIQVRFDQRQQGESQYTFLLLIRHVINLVTGFSPMPLQLASFVGFGFTILGMVTFFYIVIGYFIHGRVVPGFAFLGSIVSIFAGAQLFAIGIIGEYIARMYFRILEHPTYTVRNELPKSE